AQTSRSARKKHLRLRPGQVDARESTPRVEGKFAEDGRASVRAERVLSRRRLSSAGVRFLQARRFRNPCTLCRSRCREPAWRSVYRVWMRGTRERLQCSASAVEAKT